MKTRLRLEKGGTQQYYAYSKGSNEMPKTMRTLLSTQAKF